ncbi:MAG: hypothetical protein ACR2GB_02615, partial [Nocardioidaceae bacterium]
MTHRLEVSEQIGVEQRVDIPERDAHDPAEVAGMLPKHAGSASSLPSRDPIECRGADAGCRYDGGVSDT